MFEILKELQVTPEESAELENGFMDDSPKLVQKIVEGFLSDVGIMQFLNLHSSEVDVASATSEATDALTGVFGDGLTDQQVMQLADSNPDFSFFAHNNQQSLEHLMQQAQELSSEIGPINPDFDRLSNERHFPNNDGQRQCANYVSAILGIPSQGSVTEELIPYLIAANMQARNTTGIITDMQNYIRGDVIAFLGTQGYGQGRYGHTAIVRDTFDFNGVKYIVAQHNSSGNGNAAIEIRIFPVQEGSQNVDELNEFCQSPDNISTIPALQSAYNYRAEHPETVEIDEQGSYWGQTRVSGSAGTPEDTPRTGRIAFAVRTQGLPSSI
jgi:hypothetical protein